MNPIFKFVLGLLTLGITTQVGTSLVQAGSECRASTTSTSINSNTELESRFLESVEENVVQVNNLCFEILVPERVWIVQEADDISRLPIGIRITNMQNRSTRLVGIEPLGTLTLEIRNSGGSYLEPYVFRDRLIISPQFICRWLMPTESFVFFLDAYLLKRNGQIILTGSDGLGGFWGFDQGIELGPYQIRLGYLNENSDGFCHTPEFFNQVFLPEQVTDLWQGHAYTPWINIEIANELF
jgi:hypothetical protein